jgi:Putative prokaryotic signal transducing protein
MAKFVTLCTFDNTIEAHIVKGLLESENVAFFLVGEHFFGVQVMLNVGLAHIRMQVPANQLAQAKQLLEDYRQGSLE